MIIFFTLLTVFVASVVLCIIVPSEFCDSVNYPEPMYYDNPFASIIGALIPISGIALCVYTVITPSVQDVAIKMLGIFLLSIAGINVFSIVVFIVFLIISGIIRSFKSYSDHKKNVIANTFIKSYKHEFENEISNNPELKLQFENLNNPSFMKYYQEELYTILKQRNRKKR